MNIRFIIIFLLSLLVASTTGRNASAQQDKSSGARFALVIGNAKYPDSDAPLTDAINDARELAKELRRNGFDVDIGENLSKDAMRSALDRLYGKIKSGSVALLFFSGYGIQSDRQSYMIPVDAQIWTEPDVRRDGFSVDSMLSEMNIKGANVKVAILNASRRNPFERRFRPVAAGLAPVIAPRDTMIMYSAAPGTVAGNVTTDQSLFVTELIKEMRTQNLTGEEVFTHTRFSVTRASRGDQTPWFSSSLAEEFYFNQSARRDSYSTVAPPPVRESEPERRPAPATDSEDQARRDYQRAGQIGTRKGWEDFLDKHPTGHYAILAEDQLAKLDSPRVSSKPSEPEPVKSAPAEKSTQDDDAIRDLNRRLQNDPKNVDARNKRGALYAKNGDYSLAIKDFNEVIRVSPDDADALNNRCWARAMLDELQSALKDCDEALRIRPRFADALDSRGFVKLKIGLPRNALTDYDASLQINANQASSLYGRGIAKMRSGNTAGGNSDIAAAKSINPRIADEFASYGIR
jgi:tetratricopeptide (TPR) repeat protein